MGRHGRAIAGSRPAAAVAREIDDALRALANPIAPELRAVRREFSRQLRDASPRVVIDTALRLKAYSGPGHRGVGAELIFHHPTALHHLRLRDVEELGAGMADWGAVDVFGCTLSGPAWREGRISDAAVHRWAKSRDRWWRRAALVSTVPLNVQARGGMGDTARTLAVCKRLAADDDDMVVKAMSWALRCLTPRDPAAVRAFLSRHEPVLAARVLREVRNKLETGLKNPRKNKG